MSKVKRQLVYDGLVVKFDAIYQHDGDGIKCNLYGSFIYVTSLLDIYGCIKYLIFFLSMIAMDMYQRHRQMQINRQPTHTEKVISSYLSFCGGREGA